MDQTTLNNHYKNLAGKYEDSYSKTTAAGEFALTNSYGSPLVFIDPDFMVNNGPGGSDLCMYSSTKIV